MILIYAFSNRWATNISRRVLTSLQQTLNNTNIVYLPVNSSPQVFYKKHVEFQQYSLIIGLGDGPKYLDKIAIETQTTNSYNQQSIYPYSPVKFNISLPPLDDFDHRFFKTSSNMGIFNCNYLAYRTELNIHQKKLSTFHLFFHLPTKANAKFIADKIIDFFTLNQLC